MNIFDRDPLTTGQLQHNFSVIDHWSVGSICGPHLRDEFNTPRGLVPVLVMDAFGVPLFHPQEEAGEEDAHQQEEKGREELLQGQRARLSQHPETTAICGPLVPALH